MSEQQGGYYVPEYSVWPIIGAIGLLLFAIGSLNFSDLWGMIVFGIGALTLIYMLCGWLTSVIRESRAGLYDKQMNRTFRWGMFWFIFCETFAFGILLGALLYERFGVIPALAGEHSGGSLLTNYLLWPNFQATWPLLKNPDPALFAGLHQVPIAWGLPALNTLLILCSAVTAIMTLWFVRHNHRLGILSGLIATIILGIAFAAIQADYFSILIHQYNVSFSSGIYGSLVFFMGGFHLLNVIVALLVLLIVFIRYLCGHFTADNHFGIEASIWYWSFIAVMWLLIFLCIYGF